MLGISMMILIKNIIRKAYNLSLFSKMYSWISVSAKVININLLLHRLIYY